MPPLAATSTTCSLPLSDLSLIVQRIKDPSLRARLMGLAGDDAQCIADFLSTLLHEGTFSPEDKRYLLALLRKLVKSTEVLPQSYKLQDIQFDFSQAREGGAFADIFQGEYQGRKVCVKAVRVFQRGDNARMLRAFAKEIVLWAHLSHENILPFYGIYQGVSGRICIISPWIDGGDLSAYLQSFPHRPRLPLASDVTAGLRYLHQSNIVHGDLKAKNILVSDRGRALIADFGISVVAVSIKLPSTQLSSGTMRWMAPELLQDDNENTPSVTLQSDVWSLGCVFYEIFTRKVPFYNSTSDARVSLTRLDPMAIPSRPKDGNEVDNINDDMWDLMKKCWDHDPRSRPNSNDVYALITGRMRVREQQCSQDDSLWKYNRGGTEVETIYEHARRFLFPSKSTSAPPSVEMHSATASPADLQQPIAADFDLEGMLRDLAQGVVAEPDIATSSFELYEFLTAPWAPSLDAFGESSGDTPLSDFLLTPVIGPNDVMFSGPHELCFFSSAVVDDESSKAPVLDTSTLFTMSPTSPTLNTPALNPANLLSPALAMDNAFPSLSTLSQPLDQVPSSAPETARRRIPATGTHKNILTDSLVPLDAPTQTRCYLPASATSRTEIPAVFARRRARRQILDDEDDELEPGALKPNATELEQIEWKRRQNTLVDDQGDTADHHHTNVINIDDRQSSGTFPDNTLQSPLWMAGGENKINKMKRKRKRKRDSRLQIQSRCLVNHCSQ